MIVEWKQKSICKGPDFEKLAKLPDGTNAIRKPLLGKEMWFLTILSCTEKYIFAQKMYFLIKYNSDKTRKKFNGKLVSDT
mgnify:CR=1 FL=1